jgi:hypothetical protein
LNSRPTGYESEHTPFPLDYHSFLAFRKPFPWLNYIDFRFAVICGCLLLLQLNADMNADFLKVLRLLIGGH